MLELEAQLAAVREQSAVKEDELRHTVEVLRQEKKVLEDRLVAQDAQAVQEGDQLVQKVLIHYISHAAMTVQSILLASYGSPVCRLVLTPAEPSWPHPSRVDSCCSSCRASAASESLHKPELGGASCFQVVHRIPGGTLRG